MRHRASNNEAALCVSNSKGGPQIHLKVAVVVAAGSDTKTHRIGLIPSRRDPMTAVADALAWPPLPSSATTLLRSMRNVADCATGGVAGFATA
jgi:hypothetical protein